MAKYDRETDRRSRMKIRDTYAMIMLKVVSGKLAYNLFLFLFLLSG